MFDKSNCMECETVDCMMKCQWIQFENIEEAKTEIQKLINEQEDCRILKDCMLCFACDEYCPYHSHPFDIINELQERYHSQNIPDSVTQNSIDTYRAKREFIPRPIDPKQPVLNKCAFPKVNAKEMSGPMFENLQSVGGLHFFCQLVYQHVAKPSVIKERVPVILDNFIKTGVSKDTEVICWHDECYGLYTSYCQRNNIEVPFKPVHIFEYVYNYLTEHESEITKLNLKAAYQRNCSNRYVPETDKILDKICELIGVERLNRKYDRENGICCAAAFGMRGHPKIMRKAQNDNVQDMVDYGAEICIFNCPACRDSLERKITAKGIKSYFISDLARLALGEKLDY
jgi:Fe-S oxidoreductase